MLLHNQPIKSHNVPSLEERLRIVAYLYFNNLRIAADEDGPALDLDREWARDFLDEHNVAGWDSDKADLIFNQNLH